MPLLWPSHRNIGGSILQFREAGGTMILTGTDERNAYTTYHHNECGKVWQEKPDDHTPNYCPGCGDELTEEVFR